VRGWRSVLTVLAPVCSSVRALLQLQIADDAVLNNGLHDRFVEP
jgi:hypothetical protein